MAAITDLSDLINRATGGNSGTPETVFWQKVARIGGAAATAPIAGRPATLWRYDGVNFPGGAIPSGNTVTSSSTTGAMKFTDPGGGRQKHLIQAWASGLVGGTVILYDRLIQASGVGNVNTAQTVGGSITRNTGGEGNFIFIEIHTIIGTTGTTVTASYTNQAGTDARTTPAVVIGNTGFREVSRVIMLPLQAGDTGVRSVETFTLAATTGTAGAVACVIGKPIAVLGVSAAGTPAIRDFVVGLPGIPQVDSGACISALWIPQTVTAPELFGGLSYVEA